MNTMDIEIVSSTSRVISIIIRCIITSIWYSKLEKMAEIHFGSFKKDKNRVLNNWIMEYWIGLIFSMQVGLDYVFQNTKSLFDQMSTFHGMDHSKRPKNAQNASIRVALGSLSEEPDFCRTCGFRRDLEEGWFFPFNH